MLEEYVGKNAENKPSLEILEAGCGQSWQIKLNGIQRRLTGIDLDKSALEIRKNETKDLDEFIVGDLRSVQQESNKYDVIYCSYVLEHIDGADQVMKNLQRWLKPGGIMILRFPDRQSAYGFLTRMTPFWFHVFFKRVMMGDPNAGKPGFAPYPVFYDRVVSKNGMRAFCKENSLIIREEWGHPYPMPWDSYPWLLSIACRTIYFLSFGSLAYAHNNLTYIIEKR
jgi:SAM-dependent methyltransferase